MWQLRSRPEDDLVYEGNKIPVPRPPDSRALTPPTPLPNSRRYNYQPRHHQNIPLQRQQSKRREWLTHPQTYQQYLRRSSSPGGSAGITTTEASYPRTSGRKHREISRGKGKNSHRGMHKRKRTKCPKHRKEAASVLSPSPPAIRTVVCTAPLLCKNQEWWGDWLRKVIKRLRS